MANFYVQDALQVESQISGFGSQMGVDLIVKAATGRKLTPTANKTTIQVTWTDTNGAQTFARVLTSATEIDDTVGLNLGTYFPEGIVFADQAAATTFMGTIVGTIFGAVDAPKA